MSSIISTVHNPESERLNSKYIVPNIGVPSGMRLRLDASPFKKDELVTAVGWTIDHSKYCVDIFNQRIPEPIRVPTSKIAKYLEDKVEFNKGITFETKCAQNLIAGGIMQNPSAGCSAKPDCPIFHANGDLINLELKLSTKCVPAQAVLHWGTMWDVSERAQRNFPLFTTCIREATSQGIPLLQAVNEAVKKPGKNEIMRGTNVYSDSLSLEPMIRFMNDKGVDAVHFGDKGTFRISEKLARLPLPQGSCRLRVRGKHENTLTVQLVLDHVFESSIKFDLLSREGVESLKQEHLGYGTSKEHLQFDGPSPLSVGSGDSQSGVSSSDNREN